MKYTVKSGDTLSKIARANNITVAALLAANPQVTDEDLIFVGQELAIGAGQTISTALTILSRDQWRAKQNYPRQGRVVQRFQRSEVFIHHTVMIDDDNSPNVWESIEEVSAKMRQIQTVRPDLGLDVPYNFVAFEMADGGLVLAEGRGLDRSGAHTSGHNTSAIAVSFAGDFENKQPGPHLATHLKTLGQWLGQLREHQGFVNLGNAQPGHGRIVFGHQDQKQTACPGKHIYAQLDLVTF